MTDRTRALVICNPNDPTGHYLPAAELGRLLAVLPERVYVLLDEALVHFQDAEELDACLRLVDAFPRLLVVRTFSKVYGLSGLRAGYAVGTRRGPARHDRPRAGRERAEPGGGGVRAARATTRSCAAGATRSRASARDCSRRSATCRWTPTRARRTSSG